MGLRKIEFTHELKSRLMVAGLLGPLVLAVILIGGMLYNTLVMLACCVMCFEWNHIIYSQERESKELQRWKRAGIAYVTIFGCALLYLGSLTGGSYIVLFTVLVVWAIDSAAYFAGRMIGGPKIAPAISPNKTWAGLFGGMAGASLVTFITATLGDSMSLIEAVIVGVVLAVVAQSGDFYESWVKRQFDTKDSGQLLPGHGGLLDRLDGLVFVAPVIVLIVWFKGGSLF